MVNGILLGRALRQLTQSSASNFRAATLALENPNSQHPLMSVLQTVDLACQTGPGACAVCDGLLAEFSHEETEKRALLVATWLFLRHEVLVSRHLLGVLQGPADRHTKLAAVMLTEAAVRRSVSSKINPSDAHVGCIVEMLPGLQICASNCSVRECNGARVLRTRLTHAAAGCMLLIAWLAFGGKGGGGDFLLRSPSLPASSLWLHVDCLHELLDLLSKWYTGSQRHILYVAALHGLRSFQDEILGGLSGVQSSASSRESLRLVWTACLPAMLHRGSCEAAVLGSSQSTIRFISRWVEYLRDSDHISSIDLPKAQGIRRIALCAMCFVFGQLNAAQTRHVVEKTGESLIDIVMRQLRSGNEAVCMLCASLLRALCGELFAVGSDQSSSSVGEPPWLPLLALLDTEHALVSVVAALIADLARTHPRSIVPELRSRLLSTAETKRHNALVVITHLLDGYTSSPGSNSASLGQELAGILLMVIKAQDALPLRKRAAAVFVHLDPTFVVPSLCDLLHHRVVEVRAAAGEAIGVMLSKHEDVRGVFATLLDSLGQNMRERDDDVEASSEEPGSDGRVLSFLSTWAPLIPPHTWPTLARVLLTKAFGAAESTAIIATLRELAPWLSAHASSDVLKAVVRKLATQPYLTKDTLENETDSGQQLRALLFSRLSPLLALRVMPPSTFGCGVGPESSKSLESLTSNNSSSTVEELPPIEQLHRALRIELARRMLSIYEFAEVRKLSAALFARCTTLRHDINCEDGIKHSCEQFAQLMLTDFLRSSKGTSISAEKVCEGFSRLVANVGFVEGTNFQFDSQEPLQCTLPSTEGSSTETLWLRPWALDDMLYPPDVVSTKIAVYTLCEELRLFSPLFGLQSSTPPLAAVQGSLNGRLSARDEHIVWTLLDVCCAPQLGSKLQTKDLTNLHSGCIECLALLALEPFTVDLRSSSMSNAYSEYNSCPLVQPLDQEDRLSVPQSSERAPTIALSFVGLLRDGRRGEESTCCTDALRICCANAVTTALRILGHAAGIGMNELVGTRSVDQEHSLLAAASLTKFARLILRDLLWKSVTEPAELYAVTSSGVLIALLQLAFHGCFLGQAAMKKIAMVTDEVQLTSVHPPKPRQAHLIDSPDIVRLHSISLACLRADFDSFQDRDGAKSNPQVRLAALKVLGALLSFSEEAIGSLPAGALGLTQSTLRGISNLDRSQQCRQLAAKLLKAFGR